VIMRRTALLASAALACAVLAACGDGATQGPPPIVPGVVDVIVTTPNAQDQALLLAFGSAVESFAPATGMELIHNVSAGSTALLVISSAPLPAGEVRIGSFPVPDTSRVAGMTATVGEVAGADYQLRESLAGYSVRLQKR
jgi:ABC-type amino acid transport substrate-binding protein